jgi:hypothetical protein
MSTAEGHILKNTFLAMALSGDSEVESQSVCAIANVVEMVELHDKLMAENGLAPIVALAKGDNVAIKGKFFIYDLETNLIPFDKHCSQYFLCR